MKLKGILKRIAYIPFGIFKGFLKFVNNNARDIENKFRYRNAIIDDDCSFTNDTTINKGSHILNGSIINHSQIGFFTYVSGNTLIQNSVIGNYCSISHDVIIGLGLHPLELFSTSPLFYRKKNTLNVKFADEDYQFDEYKSIKIGSDVWIGARVIIIDGVKIGNGAVIATGAVVTKDVPPYAIVAGVPAKVIKFRFSEKVVENILATNWWDKHPEEIKEIEDSLSLICKRDIFNK
jgi:acetyltransferase-like isoleucine patch superfamily enzyme